MARLDRFDGTRNEDAGVVDEDVDAPKGGEGCFDGGGDVFGVADVALHAFGGPAGVTDHRHGGGQRSRDAGVALGIGAGHDGDGSTLAGERHGNILAEPAAGPGHNRHFAIESIH